MSRSTQVQLDACPNRAEHTECPEGYLQRHEWARRMSRTHRSTRCPGCKLYAIWVPRQRRSR